MKNTIIVHIHETNRLTLTMMTINVAIILPFLSRCSNLELKIIITIMMMMLLLLCAELKRECVCTAFSMALVKAASLHRLHWLNQNSRKTFGLFSSVCMCRCVCGSVSLKVKHKQWKMDRVGYEMQWAFVPFSQNWSWKLNVKFAQHFGHSARHVEIIIYISAGDWIIKHKNVLFPMATDLNVHRIYLCLPQQIRLSTQFVYIAGKTNTAHVNVYVENVPLNIVATKLHQK